MSYLGRLRSVASHGPVRPRRAATRVRKSEPLPAPGFPGRAAGDAADMPSPVEIVTVADPPSVDRPPKQTDSLHSENRPPRTDPVAQTKPPTRGAIDGRAPRQPSRPSPQFEDSAPGNQPTSIRTDRTDLPAEERTHRASDTRTDDPAPVAPKAPSPPMRPETAPQAIATEPALYDANLPERTKDNLIVRADTEKPTVMAEASAPAQIADLPWTDPQSNDAAEPRMPRSPTPLAPDPRRDPLPTPPPRVSVSIGAISLDVIAEESPAPRAPDPRPEPPRAPEPAPRAKAARSGSNGIWSGHRDFSRQYLRGH